MRSNFCYLTCVVRLFFLLFLFNGTACSKEQVEPIKQAETGVYWFASMRTDSAPQTGQSDWSSLLTQEWRQEDGTHLNFLVVGRTCTEGECHISEETTVNRCGELFDADLRGLWLPTYEHRNTYQKWQVKCYAARIVSQADTPRESFVNEFKMDEAGFRNLPLDVAWPMGWKDKELLAKIQTRGGGFGDYLAVAVPDASVSASKAGGQMQVVLTYGAGWTQVWSLLATGDFSHDQFADLLISSRLYSEDSLIDGYRLFVVTREGKDAPLTLAEEIVLGTAAGKPDP